MNQQQKRRRIRYALSSLILLGSIALSVVFWPFGKGSPTESFQTWYQNYRGEHPYSSNGGKSLDTFVSSPLNIDRIYRSMQGPYEVAPILLNEGKKELVWLTGYSVKVHETNGNQLPDGFMCHNNLNVVNKNTSPWRIKTHGSNIRLFTTTEGQTSIQLPEGFGVPIMSNVEMEIVSQVLNHNNPEMEVEAEHRISIDYVPDQALAGPMIPLYQQAVFVTKQTEGPVGDEGTALLCNAYEIDSTNLNGNQPNNADNSRQVPYNPFEDEFGRKYTGHWNIPQGEEVLATNVTRMLNLEFDTKIHYIGAHLHPFAESLALVDLTTGDTLHTIQATNHVGAIGLQYIESYSSAEGIPVYKNHQYAAVSVYNCDQPGEHTAMATLFLYLQDQ